MKTILSCCLTFLVMSVITHAYADVKLSGYFITRAECPAYQSFRRQTNPGDIVTQVDHAYDLLGKNKPSATHYRIKMNARPKQRWVAASCGEHVVPVESSIKPPIDTVKKAYILAVSWQPGFCETRPAKPECKSQTEDRFDASHFTLHGLWPQPRSKTYCNVAAADVAIDKNHKWADLPAIELKPGTREQLNRVMPGSQSNLHRHEWIKHGTCYNDKPAEDYYHDSLKLMNELNGSALQTLFANNIGKEITATQIRQAFENTFGDGAGDKIKIACKNDGNRRLITEITLALQGKLDQLSMADALSMAADANNIGCNRGVVDPVGLQ